MSKLSYLLRGSRDMSKKWDHLVEVNWPASHKFLALDLDDSEERGLAYAGHRYLSADILWNAYDAENKRIPAGYAAMAYIATAGDGGDTGTVPLIGGTLKRKVDKIFSDIYSRELNMAAEVFYEEEYSTEEQAKSLVPWLYRFYEFY